MKFPDVSVLGHADVDGAGRFVLLMVNEDWEPDDGHDSDHATGGCVCPCYPPLQSVLDAVEEVTSARLPATDMEDDR